MYTTHTDVLYYSILYFLWSPVPTFHTDPASVWIVVCIYLCCPWSCSTVVGQYPRSSWHCPGPVSATSSQLVSGQPSPYRPDRYVRAELSVLLELDDTCVLIRASRNSVEGELPRITYEYDIKTTRGIHMRHRYTTSYSRPPRFGGGFGLYCHRMGDSSREGSVDGGGADKASRAGRTTQGRARNGDDA